MAIKEKINRLNKLLSRCTLCPHRCRVDRISGEKGFCGAGKDMIISTAMPHHGEEPPISGTGGSGTIFFSHCNMRCCYCQNYQISQERDGYAISPKDLAEKMVMLKDHGVHNINLVSPSIWLPGILKTLKIARKSGMGLPIVYNTGGYDDPAIIKMLEGIIDIYMPDMRYSDSKIAEKYSSVDDYVKYNRESIIEMFRQVGPLRLNKDGIAQKGLLVRLLVMPGNISGIKDTLDFIKDKISLEVYLSIMAQYHPSYKAQDFPELSRRITAQEYRDVLEYAASLGFKHGWTQDHEGLDPDKDYFIPDFDDKDVFRYYRDR
jgi:putative pyruvate formate lyase activating enzyme